MKSGYKHFSHTHNLMLHEMPEGAQVSCCGCNSAATKTVYICSQCNFYLHEQCFRATRSWKHPSHPVHPLTLVPYPTYPSNSFYCNFCKIIGTGFSYSCSDCDFDIHVHCAHSISNANNFHHPRPSVTSPHPHDISHPNNEIVSPHFHSQISSMVPNVASVFLSIPTPIPTPISGFVQYPIHAAYPTTITQYSNMTQNLSHFSAPISVQTQYITNAATSAQNSSIPQNTSLASPATFVPNEQLSYYGESGQNRPKNQGIKHFSHPHGLVLVNIKHGNRQLACSGCKETLVGKGYACVEENCAFQLGESCFNLEKVIHHKSHPAHPLSLLSSSPYNNVTGMFTCNACFREDSGFTYHCLVCEYDLHVKCATLKETVKRGDHEHALQLIYECPLKEKDSTFYCDVCNRVVPRGQWTYYCKECDYGTHLVCVNRDGMSMDHATDARTNIQRLEEEMEVGKINAMVQQHILDLWS